MSVTRYHAELTQLDKNNNEHVIYPKTTISDVYTTSTSSVTIAGKLSYYAECNTEMPVKEKTVTIPGFVLDDGVQVSLRFTSNGESYITENKWTLVINGGHAIPIDMNLETGLSNTARIYTGDIITFVYSKSSNSFIRVTSRQWLDVRMQDSTNTARVYLAGFAGINYLTEGSSTSAYAFSVRSKIYAEGDTLYASKFSGNGSSLSNLDASNIASGVLNSNRLPDISGVNPASYGPAKSMVLNPSNSFNVPSIAVDKKGRITAISNQTITLPQDRNDKVVINMNAPAQSTTKKLYLALSDWDFTRQNESQLISSDKIYYDDSTQDIHFPGGMHASNVHITNGVNCKDSTGNIIWSINNLGIFSGKSSSVLSISEHISATEESTSKAYPSANGVALYNDVSDLKTSKQNTITGAATTITSSNLTANRVLVSDANGKVSASGVTATKLGYLNNVSSDIQSQLTTITNTLDLRGTLVEKYYEKNAVRADIEHWAVNASVTLPPNGTYLVRVSVHGVWKGTRTHLGIGWSTDNLKSYTYISQGLFPDNNMAMSHILEWTDFVTTDKNTTASVFPWFTEDVNDNGDYGEHNLNTLYFRTKVIRVK